MINVERYIGLLSILILFLIIKVDASIGDSTPFFQKCTENCRASNCTLDGSQYRKEKLFSQPFIHRFFFWTCTDDCKYVCMWKTVDAFKGRNWEIPQFFGKWPFTRVFGMQEFGSVIGSFLNLIAHIVCYRVFKQVVSVRHPIYWLWRVFYLVCVNAWIWSIIFHIRDTPFTEFMDYACAFSMVVIVFYCFGMRVLHGKPKKYGLTFTCLCASYFVNHIFYLYSGQIDYGYNMKANIVAGALGGVGWVIWSCVQMWRGKRYVWRCLLFVILTAASMLLELRDFPPIMQFWDAHAIWHLSTSPLPFIFYRFCIDDCRHIRKYIKQDENLKTL